MLMISFRCWDLSFLAYSCLIRLPISLLFFNGFSKVCDSLLKRYSNRRASRDSITSAVSAGQEFGCSLCDLTTLPNYFCPAGVGKKTLWQQGAVCPPRVKIWRLFYLLQIVSLFFLEGGGEKGEIEGSNSKLKGMALYLKIVCPGRYVNLYSDEAPRMFF